MIAGVVALLILAPQVQRAEKDNQCIACHEDQALEVKGTLHQLAGVGCVSCHGTDEIVNEKHKRTAAFRPAKLPQIAELCSTCHLAVSEFFWMSPHADAAASDDGEPKHRSSCSACHEYHSTTVAHRPTILALCLKCHERTSHEYKGGADAFAAMDKHEEAVGKFEDHVVKLLLAPGIRLFDLAGAVEEGRVVRTRLRIAQHGLEWKRVKADAAASAERSAAAYNTLAAREESFARRYFGLGLFLGLLALCAVLVVRRARLLQGDSGP